jgi:fatty acid desaturase
MTVIERKPGNQIAHLTDQDLDDLARELDAIREHILMSRGESDAAYIRKVVDVQRKLEFASRGILLFSLYPPAWIAGTAGLAVSKILENMELGHNIMHGQWDWMRDPKIHSTTWEWDHAMPSEMWKHAHNQVHHKYTNVLGRDKDLSFGFMRMDEDISWRPFFLLQPLLTLITTLAYQYGQAFYDLDFADLANGPEGKARVKERYRAVMRKLKRQSARDYLVHPLLSGPSALATFAANLVADVARNAWETSVIMCGHFPAGVEVFDEKYLAGESRGQWYLRQMLGSANISGGPLLHLMTGNLSFQIEHHLYPDLPSNRYSEIAPKVQELFERYGLTYTTGSFPRQVASAWAKVIRLSLPDDVLAKTASAVRRRPTAVINRFTGSETQPALTVAA